MLTMEYVRAGRIVRFIITRAALGWDVRQETDDRLVKETHYNDWHRVERAVQTFELLGNIPAIEPAEA
jgi:hypothetical protein